MIHWIKTGACFVLVLFALAGLYGVYRCWRYSSIQSFVMEKESTRAYHPDLLYLEPLGEPVFWSDQKNRVTLFFVEGFRGQAGAGIYRKWFKELYDKHGVNIVSPVVGLQGWPFKQRNREWHHQEDMRQVLQIYDAYTASLPRGHRVILATQSFGALSNITINALAKRKPDASVLISPLNTGLAWRFGNPVVNWLSQQTHWLRYIMPFMKRGDNPSRRRVWGLVNDKLSADIWESMAKDVVNWEENLQQAEQVKEAALYMEDKLVPKVSGRNFLLVHGDDDLYFTADGFNGFADKIRTAGNRVDVVTLPKTGHVALFDNGGPGVKVLILDLLMDNYRFK